MLQTAFEADFFQVAVQVILHDIERPSAEKHADLAPPREGAPIAPKAGVFQLFSGGAA
jgi:hypothetical protein